MLETTRGMPGRTEVMGGVSNRVDGVDDKARDK